MSGMITLKSPAVPETAVSGRTLALLHCVSSVLRRWGLWLPLSSVAVRNRVLEHQRIKTCYLTHCIVLLLDNKTYLLCLLFFLGNQWGTNSLLPFATIIALAVGFAISW